MENKVLTKALIVSQLNENIGLSKSDCQIFFEYFIQIIANELKNHESVKIVNFGVFSIRKKNSRIGRNPRTKKEVVISKRTVVKFKASTTLLTKS